MKRLLFAILALSTLNLSADTQSNHTQPKSQLVKPQTVTKLYTSPNGDFSVTLPDAPVEASKQKSMHNLAGETLKYSTYIQKSNGGTFGFSVVDYPRAATKDDLAELVATFVIRLGGDENNVVDGGYDKENQTIKVLILLPSAEGPVGAMYISIIKGNRVYQGAFIAPLSDVQDKDQVTKSLDSLKPLK